MSSTAVLHRNSYSNLREQEGTKCQEADFLGNSVSALTVSLSETISKLTHLGFYSDLPEIPRFLQSSHVWL